MPISQEQVRHVALLARLGLTDSEVGSLRLQLESILDHMKSLEELDVSAIAPTARVIPLANVLRPDEPRPSFTNEEALQNAPRSEDGLFRVAHVFEEN